ncbi:MAG TPA: helix-turn-helix domain-containing protein, partial [Sphingopyxis sp.]|nr:helix-turn-helix domain-containing protein [Sphingopyxis sp.]
DLYYRLAEMVVKIPSLAERPGDAVLLARHFLHQYAPEMNPGVRGFAPDALQAIDEARWPGNVRELENRIKRAVIMADGKLVAKDDLDLTGGGESEEAWLNLRSAREAADRVAIRRAMTQSEGNISAAAKLLGISRPTLYDLLKQYRIQS